MIPGQDDGIQIPIRVGPADTAGVDQAKSAIKDLGNTAEQAGNKTAESAAKGAEGLRGLSGSGRAASEVFRGVGEASEGGGRGLLGLVNIARGALHLFEQLGAVLSGGLILGLGAVAAGFAYLSKAANENKAYMEQVFTDAKARAESYEQKLKALKEASAASFAAQLEDVKKLVAEYDELVKAEDKAEKRAASLDKAKRGLEDAKLDRAEQEELLGAGDPEARERISAKYSQRRDALKTDREKIDLENEARTAALRRENSDKKLNEVQQTYYAAQKDVSKAEDDVTAAVKNATQVAQEFGLTANQADDARQAAKLAEEALKLQRAHLKEISDELQKVAGKAQEARDTENEVKDLAPIKLATIAEAAAAAKAKGVHFSLPKEEKPAETRSEQSSASRERDALAATLPGIDSQIERLKDKDRLTFAPGGDPSARAEIQRLTRVADETRAALQAKDDIMLSSYKGIQKDAKKITEQMANNRQ